MKFDTLSLLFCLYVLVLVLMSIKYLFTKTRLTNTDIVIHLLVIVILGILVAYTNKKEHFLNPAGVNYKMSPLNQKETVAGQQVDAAIFYKEPKKANLKVGKVCANPLINDKCPDQKVKANYGEQGSPLNYKMGPYSGVKISEEKHKNRRVLIPGLDKKIRIDPDKVGLFKNPRYTDPLGEESALNLKYKSGPPVDGREGSPNAMFMFAHNKCHPGCCPSTYSCDNGCVCTTEEQRRFIGNSGNYVE